MSRSPPPQSQKRGTSTHPNTGEVRCLRYDTKGSESSIFSMSKVDERVHRGGTLDRRYNTPSGPEYSSGTTHRVVSDPPPGSSIYRSWSVRFLAHSLSLSLSFSFSYSKFPTSGSETRRGLRGLLSSLVDKNGSRRVLRECSFY